MKLDNYLILYDADGAGAANADIGLFKKIGPIMGNYFPESLFRLYILRAGIVINSIYYAVQGFMHERTRKKVGN